MGNIRISCGAAPDVTLLSNQFIDYYMPEANGEFVKVYLHLLRSFSQAPASFSLPSMADRLNCTERDITRALKYWEKLRLLTLTTDDTGALSSVELLPVPVPEEIPERETAVSQEIEAAPNAPEAKPAALPLPEKPAITRQRRNELAQIEDIQQLLFVAEQYLGKTLSTSNTDKILYFYDILKFSAELIEYLIEYCVSKGHPSMRYIETVALAWAEKGITTVEQAKLESSLYHQEYYAVLKALGITNRAPVESEIRLMNVWLKEYGFSLELITQACSRTILQTGQSSFQYTDKILSDWKQKGVTSLKDIEKLDLAHQRKKNLRTSARSNAAAANRFNNFPQRDYDFTDYEKRLLNQ